jgi:hypothetical protein
MQKRPVIPEQRNYTQALTQALEIARVKLLSGDINEIVHRSGAKYIEIVTEKAVVIRYLGKECRITLPDADVLSIESGEKLPIRERLLVLHYLLTAKGTPLVGRSITLKEIPDGLNYFPTFTKRALKPLIDTFGKEPGRLVEAARKMGGRKADYGDASAVIDAFPSVPLTFVLWRGDNEFPATASILFDSSVTDCLPVEDIIVLSEITAWKLVRGVQP